MKIRASAAGRVKVILRKPGPHGWVDSSLMFQQFFEAGQELDLEIAEGELALTAIDLPTGEALNPAPIDHDLPIARITEDLGYTLLCEPLTGDIPAPSVIPAADGERLVPRPAADDELDV